MVEWTRLKNIEWSLGEIILVILSVIIIYEASGIQFILPIFFLSILGLFVFIELFIITEAIKQGNFKKAFHNKRLNRLITKEKEIMFCIKYSNDKGVHWHNEKAKSLRLAKKRIQELTPNHWVIQRWKEDEFGFINIDEENYRYGCVHVW